jgi:transposase, IS30 family
MRYKQLTEEERYQIYALKTAGYSQQMLAEHLHRSPSTISRELARNTGLKGYRPKQAHQLSDLRRRQAMKHHKLDTQAVAWINTLLNRDLSPEQISGYLARHRRLKLSHETIYQYIYRDQVTGGTLYLKLRHVPKGYRKRYGSYQSRGQIVGRIGIEQRPAVVDRKNRLGDWEGDTIIGKGRKSALLTLVERKSLYTLIVKLTSRSATELADKLILTMKRLKVVLKTLTVDNGKEFADHKTIAEQLGAEVYFAHPYSSWERGINENTNGLIRQYFPKGTDFNGLDERDIQHVMDKLNNRPRKTRNYKTPNEIFLGQSVDLLAA